MRDSAKILDREESVPQFKSNFARSYYAGDSQRSGSRQNGGGGNIGNDSCGRIPSATRESGIFCNKVGRNKLSSGSLHSSQLNSHGGRRTKNKREEQ